MKKVYLKFYDKKNLGDDLFVEIITKRYLNIFTFITPFRDSQFKKISNIVTHNNPLLFNLSRILRKIILKKDAWLDYLIKKQDLLVYIGGSLFIEGNDIKRWEQELKFYKNSPVPYHILGSNYGPEKTSAFRNIVRSIFKGADDVVLRDSASYNLFKDLKQVRLTTDIVFTLDTSGYTTDNDKKLAVFSLVDCSNRFDKKTTDKYDLEVTRMTTKLVNEGYEVVYMSFCKFEGDEIANQRILGLLDSTTKNHVQEFKYDGNLDAALHLIATSNLVVASRFHAAILGLVFSKKILPLAYSQKTTNILNDLNFKDPIVNIGDIHTFDGSSFDFDNLHITDVSAQVKKAEMSFRELDKVLDRR